MVYVDKQLRTLKNKNIGTDNAFKLIETSYIVLEKLKRHGIKNKYINRLNNLFNDVAVKYLPECDNQISKGPIQPLYQNMSLDDLF